MTTDVGGMMDYKFAHTWKTRGHEEALRELRDRLRPGAFTPVEIRGRDWEFIHEDQT